MKETIEVRSFKDDLLHQIVVEIPEAATKAERFAALAAARKAFWAAESPAPAEAEPDTNQELEKLLETRRFLAASVGGRIDSAVAVVNRAHEEADGNIEGAYRAQARYLAGAKAATAALAAFDAAHPEVLIEMKRQEKALAARHLWD